MVCIDSRIVDCPVGGNSCDGESKYGYLAEQWPTVIMICSVRRCFLATMPQVERPLCITSAKPKLEAMLEA